MTLLLAISSLISRLLGFVRNYLLAAAFGAGAQSDAYFAAFQIPDTLYRLLVAGAISASFVPLFLSLRRDDQREAWKFVSSVMNILILAMGILSAVIFLFAPEFTRLFYPGFSDVLQKETTSVLRIIIISPILFCGSAVFSGIQNAFRRFFGFALAPIVYNLGIIFGITVLVPFFGIAGVAYGVMIGAVFHVLVQWIPVRSLGFQWFPEIRLTPSLKKFFWITWPRLFTMAGLQVMFFVEGMIASALQSGDLSVLRFAEDIQYFPVGILGLSMAISSFSVISELIIDGKHGDLAQYIRDKLDHLLILLVPAAAGMFLLREPLVRLALQGGKFSEEQVLLTASVLAALTVDIVATAMIPMLARIFFAFHDSVRPFLVTTATLLLNSILALLLAPRFGVQGIAFAGSLAATAAVIIFLIMLRKRYFPDFSFFSAMHFFLFLAASGVMMALLSFFVNAISFSDRWIVLLLEILGVTGLGAMIYFGILSLFLGKKVLIMLRRIGE